MLHDFRKELPIMSKLLYSLLITVAACLCATLLFRLAPFQRMELTVSDYRFKLRGQRTVDDSLSLILVDQHTAKEYGFPFSRRYYAILANALAAVGVKVIAFDYIFDQERPEDQLGDQMLVEVTSLNENVIHAWNASLRKASVSSNTLNRYYQSGIPSSLPELLLGSRLYNTTSTIYLPYPHLLRVSDSLGIISVIPDADGAIRRIPLLVKHGGRNYPSFALLIACRALNVSPVEAKHGEYLLLKGARKEIKIPIDSMGQMLVNYAGGIMSFANTKFSFYDVYESIVSDEPIVPLSVFKDKVVIIGISDPVSSDICSTPFDNLFPGVAVHAMAVNTILQHRFLDKASSILNVVVLLFFAVAAALVTGLFRPWLAAISTGILMAVLWFISYISFISIGMILSFVQPATGIVLSFGGMFLSGYMREIHKSQALRDIFQKHVSLEVMQEIINQAEHIVPVERKKVTVLFSDLKDSVPWAEALKSEPERLVEELNEYFSEMVDVIFQYGGTLLKFTGDGLIAVYGAPLGHPTPALNAVLTGIKMQRRLDKLNTQRVAAGKQTLFMRIGINTGEAVLGSIGSEKRREYTAIGDTVNVAQRTEGQCEPGCVTITHETYQEVKEHIVVEPMGIRSLKGKSEPAMLYRVIE
jgi:adenylate cyclase